MNGEAVRPPAESTPATRSWYNNMNGEAVRPTIEATPATRSWHNELPQVVVHSDEYKRLTPQHRHTLQAIANRCERLEDGSLVGAYGGRSLVKQIGCSTATFWRHIRALERRKLVVLLVRGEPLEGRNYANVYGIPARPGALDAQRAEREKRIMYRERNGRQSYTVLRPGQQATLWAPQSDTESETGVLSICDGGTLNLRRGYSQNETPPYHGPSPLWKNHDHGVSREKKKKRRWHPGRHLTLDDLKNTQTLCVMFEHAVNAGALVNSEDNLLWFIAAAEHALRQGSNPIGLFLITVNEREQRVLYVTAEDEDRANARLKRLWNGELT